MVWEFLFVILLRHIFPSNITCVTPTSDWDSPVMWSLLWCQCQWQSQTWPSDCPISYRHNHTSSQSYHLIGYVALSVIFWFFMHCHHQLWALVLFMAPVVILKYQENQDQHILLNLNLIAKDHYIDDLILAMIDWQRLLLCQFLIQFAHYWPSTIQNWWCWNIIDLLDHWVCLIISILLENIHGFAH